MGTRGDRVVAVLDPERDGTADEVVEFAQGLKMPNGVALAPDGALFVVEQHRITRFDPGGERKVVVPPGVLPDFRHHGRRYAAFGPDQRLYVTVGAPCNVCAVRGFEGTIIRLRPDGHELEVFARGVRTLGLDWHPRTGELLHRQRRRSVGRSDPAGRAQPRGGARSAFRLSLSLRAGPALSHSLPASRHPVRSPSRS